MTRDDIVRMAREVAGVTYPDGTTGVKIGMSEEHLERFANLVAAASASKEREACADLLDKGVDLSGLAGSPSMQLFCATLLKGFADSIRERGAP